MSKIYKVGSREWREAHAEAVHAIALSGKAAPLQGGAPGTLRARRIAALKRELSKRGYKITICCDDNEFPCPMIEPKRGWGAKK